MFIRPCHLFNKHCIYNNCLHAIEALRCLLFHGDGGHIGGKNCIEAALQYGRHHYRKSKQCKASISQEEVPMQQLTHSIPGEFEEQTMHESSYDVVFSNYVLHWIKDELVFHNVNKCQSTREIWFRQLFVCKLF